MEQRRLPRVYTLHAMTPQTVEADELLRGK